MFTTKNPLLLFFIIFILTSLRCRWPLDNPSDSMASEYTEESKAEITVASKGPFFQFDTVYFDGGVSSKLVEDAGLVRRYLWDFGNDGQIDTVIRKRTRLGVPLKGQVPFLSLWRRLTGSDINPEM